MVYTKKYIADKRYEMMLTKHRDGRVTHEVLKDFHAEKPVKKETKSEVKVEVKEEKKSEIKPEIKSEPKAIPQPEPQKEIKRNVQEVRTSIPKKGVAKKVIKKEEDSEKK